MAKRLSKRKNKRNWKKGLNIKLASLEGTNAVNLRKGQILT